MRRVISLRTETARNRNKELIRVETTCIAGKVGATIYKLHGEKHER